MIEVFAHRAKINSKENTIEGVQHYIKNKISIELDLRYNDVIYLSHDPKQTNELFEDSCKLIKDKRSRMALHVKEFNSIPHILMLIKKYMIEKNCFLFMDDNEYSNIRSQVDNSIEVATYVNKEIHNIESKILWCDETKNKWFNKNTISDFHKQNKFLIGMSKELITKCGMNEINQDWKRLKNLGFDAICTDYPFELRMFLKGD